MDLIPLGSVLAGLFLVGCGGAQFAAERENGTYAFLRALPTGASPVFFVKLAVALLGSLLITVGLVAPLTWMAYSAGNDEILQALSVVLVFEGVALEVFFWILPFSLLGSRPFGAIALGVVCGLSLPWIAWPWATIAYLGEGLPAAACSRGVFLVFVICFDIWLAGRWFRAKTSSSSSLGGAFSAPSDVFYPVSAPAGAWSYTPSTPALFGRLLWQQTRETFSHWRYLLLIVAVGAVVCVMKCFASVPAFDILTGVAGMSVFLLVPILGALVFRVDQSKEHYRFLAEHGLSPRLLWTTRQIAGLLFLLAVSAFFAGAFTAYHWEHLKRLHSTPDTAEAVKHLYRYAVGLFTAYAIGQFCSMAIRSPLIAAFGAIGLSVFAVMTATLLAFFHVNAYLLAACAIVSLFVATYLGTDAWMTGRRNWRTRGRTALVLLVPILAVCTGTAFHRAFELPSVAVDIRPEQLVPQVTAEERANGEKLEAVLDAIMDSGDKLLTNASEKTVEQYRKFLRKSVDDIRAIRGVAATRWFEPEGPFFTKKSRDAAKARLRKLSVCRNVLDSEAYRLKLHGKYDEALEYVLADFELAQCASRSSGGALDTSRLYVWRGVRRLAFAAEWTPERLLEIRDEVDALGKIQLSAEAGVRLNYLTNLWELDHTPLSADMERITALLPWEKERTRRGFRILAAEQLPKAVKYDEMMGLDGLLEQPKSQQDILETKEAYPEFVWSGRFTDCVAATHRQIYCQEFERRATRLTLTLLAWKRKHGEYPKRLEELVEGGMIGQIPDIVPRGGLDFKYSPGGLEEDVNFTMSWDAKPGERDSVEWTIPAKTPLLRVPHYVMPDMAYSVEIYPTDMEKYPVPEMDGGMDGGMGMGAGGMVMGMGGGMGIGGGMVGDPMPGPAGMGAPPMPGVGVPKRDSRRSPEWQDRHRFLNSLLQFRVNLETQRALLIPLGPVKPISQEGEVGP